RDQIRGIMPEEANLKMASGSGLDPHVTPEAALRQIDTVASARQLNAQQKKVLVGLVRSVIESPDFRLLGEPRVNVLALNLAVDTAFPTQ
ncbi:potassium-transporting ATPase subunit C, partial [bacterium]|nr:potassium-transporting ATPase subunit C [bacterium]